jgi:hypothetical protein
MAAPSHQACHNIQVPGQRFFNGISFNNGLPCFSSYRRHKGWVIQTGQKFLADFIRCGKIDKDAVVPARSEKTRSDPATMTCGPAGGHQLLRRGAHQKFSVQPDEFYEHHGWDKQGVSNPAKSRIQVVKWEQEGIYHVGR